MDSGSQTSPEATTGFFSVNSRVNNDVLSDFSIPSAACNLCGTVVSTANEATAGSETLGLCSDCKFLLLEGNQSHSTRRHSSRRRVRTRRSNVESIEELLCHSSTESIELFTQQFTHMINMARQELNDDQSADGHTVGRLAERSSSQTAPSDSMRWRMVHSDTESEDDQFDSRYGESDSNTSFSQLGFLHVDSDDVSYSTYGEESEVGSVDDGDDFLDPEIFIHPDERSSLDINSDIDPMHAGLNPWNSDYQEGEDVDDGEWEEADPDEDTTASGITRTRFNSYLTSPSESNGSVSRTQSFDSSDFENMLQLRIGRSRLPPNVLTSLDDYIDDMGFETMLQHLETEVPRGGAPPASESFVKNLPRILISQEHLENNDGSACAICKDLLTTRTIVNKLPCRHLYHPNCIFQWLSVRNSCPICRYELPTDDKDYETQKLNPDSERVILHGIPVRVVSDEDSSDDDDFSSTNPAMTNGVMTNPVTTNTVMTDRCEGGGSQGRGIWFFLAAAPVVSLVGIVLAVWFSNQQRRGFKVPQNMPQIQNQRGDRARRWWPFF